MDSWELITNNSPIDFIVLVVVMGYIGIEAAIGLTYCGLVWQMATEIWGNYGSGNDLLPGGTKPLPEPMFTDHLWVFLMTLIFILDMSLKITSFRLKLRISGANKLTHSFLDQDGGASAMS